MDSAYNIHAGILLVRRLKTKTAKTGILEIKIVFVRIVVMDIGMMQNKICVSFQTHLALNFPMKMENAQLVLIAMH